jgi:hypothetical protein
MTRIRTTRDITCQVGDTGATHTIQRGTYFYALGDEDTGIVNGISIDIPGRHDPLWLFVGEDVEFVADPLPF